MSLGHLNDWETEIQGQAGFQVLKGRDHLMVVLKPNKGLLSKSFSIS
jgi:hypothetical protein